MAKKLGISRLRRHAGRMVLGLLTFMFIAVGMIAGVSKYYLIPALHAYNHATAKEKKVLGAQALLMMFVVLLMLGFALVLTFRVGRLFLPRGQAGRAKTKYVDAWAESGKRMKLPDEGEGDEK